MDAAAAALLTGLIAGFAIAMQVGAVSVLLVETAVVSGVRAGVAAGLGVATADLFFALAAAAAGGAAHAAIVGNEREIRLFAAAALAALAVHGLLVVRSDTAAAVAASPRAQRLHFARFLAVTAANPLTVVSFAAVATSLALHEARAVVAFALGVGVASTAWHIALAAVAGRGGRWLTPRVRRGLGIAGRLVVLAIAARLALAA